MDKELLWLGGAVAGYVLAMACSPVRGFMADAFNLIRERGRVRLWLPLAILSLVPAMLGWFAGEPPGAEARDSRRNFEMVSAATADGAGLFSSAVRFRPPDAARELPAKTRAGLSLAAISWAGLGVGFQFFILVALYLGVVMPERDPGLKGLIDFAWRRTVRFWPAVVAVALCAVLPLWLSADSAAIAAIWPLAAVLAVTFAFTEVALLSGDRDLKAAVRCNFSCWSKLPYHAVWFLALAAVHLFLLHSADAMVAGLVEGKTLLAVLWSLTFALIRAAVLVWLLAAWVLLFCTKTKNPTRRRIRP